MLRFSLVVICLSLAAGGVQAQDEPSYEGKTLKEWIALLKHKDAFQRQDAAFAIGQLKFKAKEGVPALIEALKDKEANVRAEAADSLGRIGYSARDAMPDLI